MTKFHVAAHALIQKDGKYLVTRRSAMNDYMPLKWDVPGGGVDPGETMEKTLVREVKEETGLTINIRQVLHLYVNLAEFPKRQTFQAVYLCDYVGGDIQLNPEEHDAYLWLNKEEMRTIDAIAFLKDFISSEVFKVQLF